MLVDNQIQPTHNFSSEYPSDFDEFLNTELFASNASTSKAGSTAASSSRASSPQSPYQSLLATPPDSNLGPSFPSIHDLSSSTFNFGGSPTFGLAPPPGTTSNSSFFNFLDEEMKLVDPLAASTAPFDFYGNLGGSSASAGGVPFSLGPATSMAESSSAASSTSSSSVEMGIDPQLVGTPSAIDEHGEHEEGSDVTEKHGQVPQEEQEKLTFTLPAVKVAGHGKARKGTVQSGGIMKKTSAPAPVTSNLQPARDKENIRAKSSPKDDDEDDDDELPADWRPPPEVLQKMTSKEKRQLRNKISARNFRVRRKEYITTLEMDVAERDRLLQAIRSELSSTQSENVSLRQEISALKKALLDGRSGNLTSEDIPVFNLPPPAPIPPLSSTPATHSSSSSPPLVRPNTQKDLPQGSSPRLGAFWGGVPGMFGGGGVTPVHTVLMPETNFPPEKTANEASVRAALQENINPTLNGPNANSPWGSNGRFPGFEGFVDTNPFTMKTLDAYRMQLWTKMAAQHHHQQQQQQHQYQQPQQQQQQTRSPTPPPLIGSPSPFTNPSLPYSPSTAYQPLHGLAASLKHLHFTSSPQPAKSPSLPPSITSGKGTSASALLRKEKEQKEQQQALIAAYASQTLVRKLTGAFWDAFTGSASSSASNVGPHHHSQPQSNLDVDKVRRVLEGKAVVKVVDVEKPEMPRTPRARMVSRAQECLEECSLTAVLEESMRSLTLGKK